MKTKREQVKQMLQAGMRQADIARAIHTSQQYVSVVARQETARHYVHLDPPLMARASEAAQVRGLSLDALLAQALEAYLGE